MGLGAEWDKRLRRLLLREERTHIFRGSPLEELYASPPIDLETEINVQRDEYSRWLICGIANTVANHS